MPQLMPLGWNLSWMMMLIIYVSMSIIFSGKNSNMLYIGHNMKKVMKFNMWW